jgi:type II secretory pathway pseudopilin PulG
MNIDTLKSKNITRRLCSSGFTLVETLVAVTVLMIAVAGPLVVASKGLTSANFARDQMTAYFLAQETMEAIKNSRDNFVTTNGVGSGSVNRVADPNSDSFGSVSSCVDIENKCDFEAGSTEIIRCDDDGCPLYSTPLGYTNSDVDVDPISLFKRYFYLTPRKTDGSAQVVQSTITVVVNWQTGKVKNEIQLSSELNDASR